MTPLTLAAAADQLGVSYSSVARMVRRRLIPSIRYPVGGIRIEQHQLDAFIAKCRRGAVVSLPTRPLVVGRERARAATATEILAARTRPR